MRAQDLKSAVRVAQTAGAVGARAARLAELWLSILLVSGLWQGYGKWLFVSGSAHVQ
jgi:hypothetical protein